MRWSRTYIKIRKKELFIDMKFGNCFTVWWDCLWHQPAFGFNSYTDWVLIIFMTEICSYLKFNAIKIFLKNGQMKKKIFLLLCLYTKYLCSLIAFFYILNKYEVLYGLVCSVLEHVDDPMDPSWGYVWTFWEDSLHGCWWLVPWTFKWLECAGT